MSFAAYLLLLALAGSPPADPDEGLARTRLRVIRSLKEVPESLRPALARFDFKHEMLAYFPGQDLAAATDVALDRKLTARAAHDSLRVILPPSFGPCPSCPADGGAAIAPAVSTPAALPDGGLPRIEALLVVPRSPLEVDLILVPPPQVSPCPSCP